MGSRYCRPTSCDSCHSLSLTSLDVESIVNPIVANRLMNVVQEECHQHTIHELSALTLCSYYQAPDQFSDDFGLGRPKGLIHMHAGSSIIGRSRKVVGRRAMQLPSLTGKNVLVTGELVA